MMTASGGKTLTPAGGTLFRACRQLFLSEDVFSILFFAVPFFICTFAP